MNAQDKAEWELIQASIARLRASIMAVVFAMVGGVGLCAATAWLLIRGGEMVGKTLSLLGHYFPGYTVSWGGCAMGFFYGAATGAVIGFGLAWLYNTFANLRDQSDSASSSS